METPTDIERYEYQELTEAEQIEQAAEALAWELKGWETEDVATWLPNWYLGKLEQLKALEAAVKLQKERIMNQIDAERKALAWKWGAAFRNIVDAQLQTQSTGRKSIDYATGRTGYRMSRDRLEVDDLVTLIKWCSDHLPDGLRCTPRLSVLLEYYKQTGQIPVGARLVRAENKFYPATSDLAIEAERIVQLEGGTDDE